MNKPHRPLIIRGPAIDWDTQAAAKSLGISEGTLLRQMGNGRFLNWLAGTWLGEHKFTAIKDGRSGFLLERDGKRYRLRVGTKVLDLGPSKGRGTKRKFDPKQNQRERAKINGHIFVFTSDLPHLQAWVVDKLATRVMKKSGDLNPEWRGKAARIRDIVTLYGSKIQSID